MAALPLAGQDTLRTYGPRLGLDLAPFVYYFSVNPVYGAEVSLDAEIVDNIFPVFELGFSTFSDSLKESLYESGGSYVRAGLDYDLYPVQDRSQHHSITIGFRYGLSRFTHGASKITIPSPYWGDLFISSYENGVLAHWAELTGGIKAEILPNFFLGWSLRYRILINRSLDEQITPLLIPGFGNATEGRAFGFSYSLMYKIPLLKK